VAALLESGVGQVRSIGRYRRLCAPPSPRTSTSLPLRHLGPGPVSVIRTSPASRRFRILNARRKMPGRPSDARCLFPASSSTSSFVPRSLRFPSISSCLLFSIRPYPGRLGCLLIDIARALSSGEIRENFYARFALHKYHSSAIPIGARSIAIDFFIGLRHARLFSLPCLLHISTLHVAGRMRAGILWDARKAPPIIALSIHVRRILRCDSILRLTSIIRSFRRIYSTS